MLKSSSDPGNEPNTKSREITEDRDYRLRHARDYNCLIVADTVCGSVSMASAHEMSVRLNREQKHVTVAIMLAFFCISLFADDWNKTASNPSLLERFLLIRNCAECKFAAAEITQHSSYVCNSLLLVTARSNSQWPMYWLDLFIQNLVFSVISNSVAERCWNPAC